MDQPPDFKIAYDGTWYHEGQPILREAMAKLFATRALVCDPDGRYWLQTPFEKYPVEVEDVPFVVVDTLEHPGQIDCVTNMGEHIPLGPDRPLVLRTCRKTDQMLPYVEVRNGLYARLGRPVYYNLVNRYGGEIISRGAHFPLGATDE